MRGLITILAVALALGGGVSPLAAQVRTVDPNQAIDSDLARGQPAPPPPAYDSNGQPLGDPVPAEPPAPAPTAPYTANGPVAANTGQAPATPDARREATTGSANTYERKDLLSAAEGVFGKGAEGLAGILEKILKDQGRPNAYIAGREASGAVVVGLRYGSGIMSHKVEGDRPVYWTGPSVGFDLGGNAAKVFVLVYNLYDSEELFRRFPEGEGHLYFVGGFSATYLRRGNVVLIPIRLGVGVRAGVNIGYMKFSKKAKWLPF